MDGRARDAGVPGIPDAARYFVVSACPWAYARRLPGWSLGKRKGL